MQVAAANPRCVRTQELSADVIESERNIYRVQAAGTGKPAAVIEKIVDGKMEKFFAESCLLQQQYVRDPQKTIAQLVTDAIAQMGENIVVRRFARFQLGENTDRAA